MRFEKKTGVLGDFDFDLLDDPDFKEDSVREEIIVPIIKKLGYSHSKPNKIIRSKHLLHPFVSIGSATKKIYIVPDYLFEVSGRYAWILDAKAPNQEILKSKHVEQAYSYAVHSEIRVPYFALCNGREFALFHISKQDPVVHFNLQLIPNYWEGLLRLLGPKNVLDYDYSLKKDYGLHLKRLGFHEFESLVFPDVPIVFIARIGEDLFTIGSGVNTEEDDYVATFDFDFNAMSGLAGKISKKAFDILTAQYKNTDTHVNFVDGVYRITIDCKVGKVLAENQDEIFLPFWVNRFLN